MTVNALLKDTEVAELLSCSRTSVWKWTRLGRLPQPVLIGIKSRRWRRDEIEAAVAKNAGVGAE